jgi:hypothetical protein
MMSLGGESEALPLPRGADPENSAGFFINGTGSTRTAISVMERCHNSVVAQVSDRLVSAAVQHARTQ